MSDPTNNLLILTVAVPVVMGLLCVPLVNLPKLCRGISLLSFAATFIISVVLLGQLGSWGDPETGGIMVSQMGDWAAPYGITLVFDSMSGLMLAGASLVALCTTLFAIGSLPARTERRYFHPLVNFLMLGVNLSFLTGDLFNLFVAFEIMLMASYGLLVIGGGKDQLRQAYKYVVMNLLASSVFVIAAGMTYGMFGTLNMADLGRLTTELSARGELPTGFTALGVLFLFVFTLKAGVFPLWFWLPDTYPTLPISIAGLFGGVLTKVGLYAIARTFSLVFLAGEAGAVIIPILAVGAALTMFVGVLGALAYTSMRRVLSMMLIVGVGYSLFGIVIMTEGSLQGAAFYMVQSMVVMAAVFLCCGLIERATGTDDIGRMGALLQQPKLIGLGVMVFIGLLSIVGLPPTSGFHGKLIIIREGLTDMFWVVGVTALLVGGLSLLAALRVWGSSFWGPAPNTADTPEGDDHAQIQSFPRSERVGAWGLIVASLLIGFAAEPLLNTAGRAGQQLAEPQAYVDAVLNNPRYAADAVAKAKPGDEKSEYDTYAKPSKAEEEHH
ncbi:proton-conducting transporter transmembrane domain-containing protein [Algisphaera agarilytica]|uniref:Multicomponent Na+:H+ antiporter subunit D n=1 Tax=Algisphaera agarilytica TaxID=1385975 RepID=A0A7X0H5D4_9BACT|nr:proton-conducting transporter membrane subunit [Algisphaera agarilytica]MBB6428436.1 multicomponent Na+:H+ antiporter subunit D [Algisphaera agarilytica]